MKRSKGWVSPSSHPVSANDLGTPFDSPSSLSPAPVLPQSDADPSAISFLLRTLDSSHCLQTAAKHPCNDPIPRGKAIEATPSPSNPSPAKLHLIRLHVRLSKREGANQLTEANSIHSNPVSPEPDPTSEGLMIQLLASHRDGGSEAEPGKTQWIKLQVLSRLTNLVQSLPRLISIPFIREAKPLIPMPNRGEAGALLGERPGTERLLAVQALSLDWTTCFRQLAFPRSSIQEKAQAKKGRVKLLARYGTGLADQIVGQSREGGAGNKKLRVAAWVWNPALMVSMPKYLLSLTDSFSQASYGKQVLRLALVALRKLREGSLEGNPYFPVVVKWNVCFRETKPEVSYVSQVSKLVIRARKCGRRGGGLQERLPCFDIVIMGIEALLSSHRSKYRIPISSTVVSAQAADGHPESKEFVSVPADSRFIGKVKKSLDLKSKSSSSAWQGERFGSEEKRGEQIPKHGLSCGLRHQASRIGGNDKMIRCSKPKEVGERLGFLGRKKRLVRPFPSVRPFSLKACPSGYYILYFLCCIDGLCSCLGISAIANGIGLFIASISQQDSDNMFIAILSAIIKGLGDPFAFMIKVIPTTLAEPRMRSSSWPYHAKRDLPSPPSILPSRSANPILLSSRSILQSLNQILHQQTEEQTTAASEG
ncbi:hypothetical protein Acr_00g0004490 [Actinidia rufa]|uniref:Uncharacterized protein n=1 Tax=Actinidia rufa TaxID=165716 RepID=A0A7J0D7F9_9ERIC|nr:hypothetical protein Acr_00g0004490 [Actinidia rufa]